MTRPMPKTTTRRRWLQGAGGLALGLPFLETFAPRQARAADSKAKRLVLFFTPEGTQADEFYPTGSVSDFKLGSISAPLEPYKRDCIFLKGINHQSCADVGSDHFSSMKHLLTGGGPDSIDQIISAQIGQSARFSSLEFAVKPRNVNEKGVISYRKAQMVPGEFDPQKMFARVFAGATPSKGGGSAPVGPSPELQAVLARRKSTIDFVKGQVDWLKKRVSAVDHARLDEHLTAIREVEKSLVAPPASQNTTVSCSAPEIDLVAGSNTGGSVGFDVLTKCQIDLMVLALACDATPVASLQLSNSGSGEGFDFLGIPANVDILHGWVHNDKGDPAFPGYAKKTFTWFADRFAYLLGRMKAVSEGSGSMLDNSVVVWMSHFGRGGAHGPDNVPWVFAGRGAGTLRPGRFLDVSAKPEPHTKLLLAMAQAMGVSLGQIGDPKYGTAPLPGLLG